MKKLKCFTIMSYVVTRGYKKKTKKIMEEESKALSVGYLERIAEEVLPSHIVIVGTSMPIVKMERLLED
jgi:hypothetical protein